MKNTVTGHCLCGHIVYEYFGPVGPANYCHCVDCRRHTGSAFNICVQMKIDAFKLIEGKPSRFSKQADSGNEIIRHFCPKCGSPIFTSSPAHTEYIYVKAGTIDDPNVVRPTHENWIVSSIPWSRIEEGLRLYQQGTE